MPVTCVDALTDDSSEHRIRFKPEKIGFLIKHERAPVSLTVPLMNVEFNQVPFTISSPNEGVCVAAREGVLLPFDTAGTRDH